jgi:hypothetical protein
MSDESRLPLVAAVLPEKPPELTIGAAVVLLRILRKAQDQRSSAAQREAA